MTPRHLCYTRRHRCVATTVRSRAGTLVLGADSNTYIHTYTHTHIHTYIHTYIHTHTQTQTHTHTHTHTHTRPWYRPQGPLARAQACCTDLNNSDTHMGKCLPQSLHADPTHLDKPRGTSHGPALTKPQPGGIVARNGRRPVGGEDCHWAQLCRGRQAVLGAARQPREHVIP